MTRLEARVLAFLHQVEAGAITLDEPIPEPGGWTVTYPLHFQASNGWTLSVMLTDGEWSHIYEINMNGVTIDYVQMIDEAPTVMEYVPSEKVLRDRYHWPYFRAAALVTASC